MSVELIGGVGAGIALSKVVNTLIEKISSVSGVTFEPRQIKRVAKAKAEAAVVTAKLKLRSKTCKDEP